MKAGIFFRALSRITHLRPDGRADFVRTAAVSKWSQAPAEVPHI